jgi:quercetin dioxygenase-like cupin family protein
MPESRYEKYICRKPAIPVDAHTEAVPETDKIPNVSPIDTGPRVIFSHHSYKDAGSFIEYGLVSGDITIGAGHVTGPHKHDYEEIFLFLGTNPEDTTDLGAEIDFWIGEGDEREKVTFTTSSSIYIPPNTVHFPQVWRNVKRPVMMVVIMPTAARREPVFAEA